jgi:ADP-ribosyl-[dinitrogen reductase] hydrolase
VANFATNRGQHQRKKPPQIKGTGDVVQSLKAAPWAFHNSADFKQGALLAINLGDDADTTGAVYGKMAGAFYRVTLLRPPGINKPQRVA